MFQVAIDDVQICAADGACVDFYEELIIVDLRNGDIFID
jgi:hypothetical protein